jgi:hypothetical protein
VPLRPHPVLRRLLPLLLLQMGKEEQEEMRRKAK